MFLSVLSVVKCFYLFYLFLSVFPPAGLAAAGLVTATLVCLGLPWSALVCFGLPGFALVCLGLHWPAWSAFQITKEWFWLLKPISRLRCRDGMDLWMLVCLEHCSAVLMICQMRQYKCLRLNFQKSRLNCWKIRNVLSSVVIWWYDTFPSGLIG